MWRDDLLKAGSSVGAGQEDDLVAGRGLDEGGDAAPQAPEDEGRIEKPELR